jgi:hypothetical protein
MVPISSSPHSSHNDCENLIRSFIQVFYLVILETVNWVCDIGLIYEPLIIRYGKI